MADATDKQLDTPPVDKMVHRPGVSKGNQAGGPKPPRR